MRYFVCTQGDPPFEGAIRYADLLDAEPREATVRENDLFGIYYTGGTTGKAKGVMLSHKNIMANAMHMVSMHLCLEEISRGDVTPWNPNR